MPSPSDYDNKDDFVSACISQRQDEHPEEDNDQSVAICFSLWSDKMNKPVVLKQVPMDPLDGESEDDFLERCTNSGIDDDTCQGLWDGDIDSDDVYMSGGKRLVHKTHVSSDVQGMEFILSDETVDRYGDVIAADGWDVTDFRKNPIALFGHRSDFPIGKWDNINVVGKELRGHLKLAPKGTSARIDEIRKLVDAGILKATSVGFAPVESKPIKKDNSNPTGGMHYTKSLLMEVSLVTVPANPNAIAVAKSLKISDDTQKLVFAGLGKRRQVDASRRNGGSAENPPRTKGKTMNTPIAQRITDAEQRKTAARDKLAAIMKDVQDNTTEEQQTEIDTLTAEMENADRMLETFHKVERHLAFTSRPANANGGDNVDRGSEQPLAIRNDRPFAAPAIKVRPSDYIWKALTVQVKHYHERGARTLVDVMKDTYAGQERMHDSIYAMNGMLTRAAQTVGLTTTPTWAAELVTVAIGDFFDLLQPVSIYAALSALGGRFTFGQNGVISIPYRTNTATIGGAFVAQGGAIPVKKASFSAINLTPKKVGVISTFTRELAEHSTPSIEQLIRDAIVADTATAIDSVLLDSNAATTTRPAGLGNGLSTQTPNSPGTDLGGVIADIKTMSNALSAGSNGNIRTPVWIMTPGAANCIALSQIASVGILPFREEVAAGRLNGWPLIKSTSTIPADTIWLIDAADFVTATTDTPRFEVSDQAVLHMDDAPGDIVSGGSAASGSVKSLWQTDSIGIRMIMDVNWAMRRTGMVYFMTGVNWSP